MVCNTEQQNLDLSCCAAWQLKPSGMGFLLLKACAVRLGPFMDLADDILLRHLLIKVQCIAGQ